MSDTSTPIPNETVMQQAWRFRLWGSGRIRTCQGTEIDILEAGKLNTGPGPDFHDARISHDGNIWAGCVEIHRHASDWHRHGHDKDHAYDNVVLHVVGNDDCRVCRPDGAEIPQATMHIDSGFVAMFNGLLNSPRYVLPMCGDSLPQIAPIFKTDWITALAFERLDRKVADILHRLHAEAGDWLQTVFITLARGLGFGANADNMERLARSIPVRILFKHTDNAETIEAILFGQAGLLKPDNPADEREAVLVREYHFYAHKYGLQPPENIIWQMSARNMANTPYRRIALLAALICKHNSHIGDKLCSLDSPSAIQTFLNVNIPEYWLYAFAFGRTAATKMSGLGKQSRELLIINVVAPLIYARGMHINDYALLDKAVALWESLDGEQNNITRGFREHGIDVRDALTSQALIQLHREYCERRRCLECRLGHRLLSSFISF